MATTTPLLSDPDLAYIAAVIDTKARIKKLYLPTGVVLPVVHLSCPDLQLLQYLGDITGITPFITRRTYKRHRCNEHCPDDHQDHVISESARWSVSGVKATILLAAIQPFIRFQKPEVDQAINLGLDAPFKAAKLKEMEKLGWSIPPELKPNIAVVR